MATVKAYYGIDSQMLDLNFYSRHFFEDFFYEDIDFRYEGRTYQDIYSINGWDLQNDLVISVLGRGFGFNSWGTVIQGTVTAITEEIYDGAMIWIAKDVSVSAGWRSGPGQHEWQQDHRFRDLGGRCDATGRHRFPALGAVGRVQPDRHRPVIDQPHRHVGAKAAGFDRDPLRGQADGEALVKPLPVVRCGSG